MKTKLFLALVAFASTPAFADIDTICEGGGPKGNQYSVEIQASNPNVPSEADSAKMNGIKTKATFEGQKGDVFSFSLEGNGRVFGLDYNEGEATAQLTGQGLNVKLFCSRY